MQQLLARFANTSSSADAINLAFHEHRRQQFVQQIFRQESLLHFWFWFILKLIKLNAKKAALDLPYFL